MTSRLHPFTVVTSRILPLRFDFKIGVRHSLASRMHTINALLELESDSGYYGFGESVPRSYVTGETPESVMRALQELIHQVTGFLFDSPEEVVSRLESVGRTETARFNPAAMCALELATLDCAGKHWEMGVPELLGMARSDTPLQYSLVVPLLPDDAIESFLEGVKPFDFSHVKIKVDATDPVGQVSRVRETLGADIEMRVDANCAWSSDNAPGFMKRLSEIGVVAVEQPLPVDNIAGMAVLRRDNGLPIVLDESAITPAHVERAANMGACDMINVRVSKCGGLLGSLRMIATARANGLGIQLGAQVGESCILSSAGAHLAAGMRDFRWLEGFFGTHLLMNDLCTGNMSFGKHGLLAQPDGVGLGVCVEPELVARAHQRYLDTENA